ncbi:ribosome maturation factor RimM [bacterium]|nr:ribosome maturation factor RimM [bacterium]
MEPQPRHVVVGVVQKAHGIKGQVKVRPLTDNPQRFKQLQAVLVEPRSGEEKWLGISQVQVNEGTVFLQFDGIEDRETAKGLSGAYLSIRADEMLPLEEDAFYHFEVIGFEVRTTTGEYQGIVERVMDLPANDVLVVKNKAREILLPVIKDVIRKVDRENKQIIIEVIDGLLN